MQNSVRIFPINRLSKILPPGRRSLAFKRFKNREKMKDNLSSLTFLLRIVLLVLLDHPKT